MCVGHIKNGMIRYYKRCTLEFDEGGGGFLDWGKLYGGGGSSLNDQYGFYDLSNYCPWRMGFSFDYG